MLKLESEETRHVFGYGEQRWSEIHKRTMCKAARRDALNRALLWPLTCVYAPAWDVLSLGVLCLPPMPDVAVTPVLA